MCSLRPSASDPLLRGAAIVVLATCVPLHAQVLINEVLPSGGDAVELYNAGDRPAELHGMRLVLGARTHVFQQPLSLAPRGHLLLRCGDRDTSAAQLPFKLPRTGGSLLLIAANGTTITDVFTWPATPPGCSIGRLPDGASDWSFFPEPTPGRTNTRATPLRGRTAPPLFSEPSGVHPGAFTLAITAAAHARVRYSTDGSDPLGPGGMDYGGPMAITGHATVRACALAEGELPSDEGRATYAVGHSHRPFLAVATDPALLFGDSGIYAPGLHSNHTRRGRAWERGAVLLVVDGDATTDLPVGLRLHGSGSRGLAKRSFRVLARDRYGSPRTGFRFADGAPLRDGLLRADAGPHAFLRNRLLETTVLRHGLHVEVQPSRPLPLYLNGRYWGLYRWMPAKSTEWLTQRAGGTAVDVLEGPAATAIAGGGRHYRSALAMLLRAAPVDSLAARIDLGSLIDLACMDLWSGRADHDLNVRCYRPRTAEGRWRWVLFDLDLWAPAEENSVQRMTTAVAPEAPFVPQLLAHPALRPMLLARMAALQATALHPELLAALADSLHAAHRSELAMDHRRWELELDAPAPEASLGTVRDFVLRRPTYLLRHLSEHTGHRLVTLVVQVPPMHQGTVTLEGLPLPPGTRRITGFAGVPMTLAVEPRAGFVCEGWNGVEADGGTLRFDPAAVRQLRPVLRAVHP